MMLLHEMAELANSSRRVTNDDWHAIEVGIVAGQIRQAMFLHHRDNQGITAQQSDLLSDGGCRGNEVRGDGQDLNAEVRNLVDDLAKPGQLPNIVGMTQHVSSDARSRPAKPVDGLQGHGAMGNIGQHVRGGIPDQFLFRASFQELLTREVQDWMRREVVDEYVRVQEHGCTARNDRPALRAFFSSEFGFQGDPFHSLGISFPADQSGGRLDAAGTRVDRDLYLLVLVQRQRLSRFEHPVFVRGFNDDTPSQALPIQQRISLTGL